MINYNPKVINKKSDTFTCGGWLDTVTDPLFLGTGKVTVADNVEFTDKWWKKTTGLTYWGTHWWWVVYWMWILRAETWDIAVRVYSWLFQYLDTWSTPSTPTWINIKDSWWTNDKTVSGIPTNIVSFNLWRAGWTDNVLNCTSTCTNRTVTVTGTLSDNIHIWEILRVTSGTWAWQEKLITGNTHTIITVEWVFETVLDATSVVTLSHQKPHVVVTNWTDTCFKWDWTTLTDLTLMPKFTSLEALHDRLWGALSTRDQVYVSNAMTCYFTGHSNLSISPDWDTIQNIVANKDELIVYKTNSRWKIIGYDPTEFTILQMDSRIWCIAPLSAVNWNNLNFFLWYDWIYCISTLESSTVDEWIPMSLNIDNLLDSHDIEDLKLSIGWINDNKYYLSVPRTVLWVTTSTVYIYDIAQSALKETRVLSRRKFNEYIRCAMVYWWVTYLGTQLYTVKMIWTSDIQAPSEITATVETGRRTQWDDDMDKLYWISYIQFTKATATCNVSVYYALDWWNYVLLKTQNLSSSWDITCFINKKGKDIKFKYTYGGQVAPEFLKHQIFYQPLHKLN